MDHGLRLLPNSLYSVGVLAHIIAHPLPGSTHTEHICLPYSVVSVAYSHRLIASLSKHTVLSTL